MQRKASWRSQVAYVRHLAQVAVDGIASTRRQTDSRVFADGLTRALCAGAVMGAGLGALRNRSRSTRRTAGPSNAVAGSIKGGIVGGAVALAWMSRQFTRLAARNAARSIVAAADQHWLESHPIDYA